MSRATFFKKRPRRPGWTRAGLVAMCVPLALALAVPAAIAAVDPLGPFTGGSTHATTPACAWPERIGAEAANIFLPDSAATYWVMPYEVRHDLRITVSGHFPDARYASFNVYNGDDGSFTSNNVSSAIADYQINPEPGGNNPWRYPGEAGDPYAIEVRMDVAPGQPNVLPLAPVEAAEGSEGFLVYRVYLPAGDASTIELPTLTLRQDGTATTLPACAPDSRGRETGEIPADLSPAVPPTTSKSTVRSTEPSPPVTGDEQRIAFARSGDESALFPNADAAYLDAQVTPPGKDKVVIFRGKAPHAVTGSHPAPWPDQHYDMRYWSACVNLLLPQRPVVVNELPNDRVDYGCRHDSVTKLDSDGYYTYVIGTERQRPAIERVPGATFLPFSTEYSETTHLVLLRNMLPSEGFDAAVQNVSRDGDPRSAFESMGEYYPLAGVCSLSTLASQGPGACPVSEPPRR